MKVETLILIAAVGAVVYFATRPAQPQPVTVVERESDLQTGINAAAGLLGGLLDLARESGAGNNQNAQTAG